MKNVNIGLFGFGVVGEGIYQVLKQKPSLGVEIQKVVVKHKSKRRNAPAHLFSLDANSILNDTTINLVVELIDDADAALEIVLTAMRNGKSVVSANKKMVAENLQLLIETAKKNGVAFLYEAAVCGSIPIIRNLEEYFNNDLVTNITGIVNGSTNYILTQMSENGWDYHIALQKAQELGFAESNPDLDVQGWDARNKLKIIALHAFGKLISDQDIQVKGVDFINKQDVEFAKEKGYVIKLLATCKLNNEGNFEEASVLPVFIPKRHPLRLTNNEFNGVLVGSELTDEQFFYGKGAGRYPTSSAVLSDISAHLFGYKYEYKKKIETETKLKPIIRKFYIGFKKRVDIDWSSIGEIVETYDSDSHCYVTLIGNTDEVLSISRKHQLSVIAYTH